MSSTTTEAQNLKRELDKADPNTLPDALRKVRLGDLLAVKEETIDKGDAVATIDLTADPADADDRGPALIVQAVEVLTGTAAAGSRRIVPSTDAASATEVVLSADGTTLTFEANVGTVRVRWVKGSDTPLTDKFAPTS